MCANTDALMTVSPTGARGALSQRSTFRSSKFRTVLVSELSRCLCCCCFQLSLLRPPTKAKRRGEAVQTPPHGAVSTAAAAPGSCGQRLLSRSGPRRREGQREAKHRDAPDPGGAGNDPQSGPRPLTGRLRAAP